MGSFYKKMERENRIWKVFGCILVFGEENKCNNISFLGILWVVLCLLIRLSSKLNVQLLPLVAQSGITSQDGPELAG